MESAKFNQMGSHYCRSGIFQSTQFCPDLSFIGDLISLPNNYVIWKSNDRQLEPKNNMDVRNRCLHLSLRFTLAHRFHGRNHASTKLGCESQIQSESESEGENNIDTEAPSMHTQAAHIDLLHIHLVIGVLGFWGSYKYQNIFWHTNQL